MVLVAAIARSSLPGLNFRLQIWSMLLMFDLL